MRELCGQCEVPEALGFPGNAQGKRLRIGVAHAGGFAMLGAQLGGNRPQPRSRIRLPRFLARVFFGRGRAGHEAIHVGRGSLRWYRGDHGGSRDGRSRSGGRNRRSQRCVLRCRSGCGWRRHAWRRRRDRRPGRCRLDESLRELQARAHHEARRIAQDQRIGIERREFLREFAHLRGTGDEVAADAIEVVAFLDDPVAALARALDLVRDLRRGQRRARGLRASRDANRELQRDRHGPAEQRDATTHAGGRGPGHGHSALGSRDSNRCTTEWGDSPSKSTAHTASVMGISMP